MACNRLRNMIGAHAPDENTTHPILWFFRRQFDFSAWWPTLKSEKSETVFFQRN
jgi:hypothetical protein